MNKKKLPKTKPYLKIPSIFGIEIILK